MDFLLRTLFGLFDFSDLLRLDLSTATSVSDAGKEDVQDEAMFAVPERPLSSSELLLCAWRSRTPAFLGIF